MKMDKKRLSDAFSPLSTDGNTNGISPKKHRPGLISPFASQSNLKSSPYSQGTGINAVSGKSSSLASPSKLREKARLSRLASKKCFFNDPIHGNICMKGLCLRIIDTKEFQRLRELKQLGTCDFVYPGATHTRFSHSIGVGHYAEVVLLQLMKNQPSLRITEQDILCVKVAGLCHDLGHGPFSHVFDGVFMTRMHPGKKWRHEEWSVNMFLHILKANNIKIEDYGLSEQDKTFIVEIIRGTDESERVGREQEKFYLYDIVNNSRSGLDVDKLDYFQRDIRHTNVYTSYERFQRFIEFGRVMAAEPVESTSMTSKKAKSSEPLDCIGSPPSSSVSTSDSLEKKKLDYMICYPEKMVGEALQLFTLRYQLHQKVYTHKSVKKVEYMLVDALEKADPYIKIPGTATDTHPTGTYRMSECVLDSAALSNLTDSIVYLIETSPLPELKPAQEILARIRAREFYDCLGKAFYKRGSKTDIQSTEEIKAALLAIAQEQRAQKLVSAEYLGEAEEGYEYRGDGEILPSDTIFSQDSFGPWIASQAAENELTITADDIIVEKMHIHYGLKSENPVSRMRFFPKGADANHVAAAVRETAYETLLPRVFEELAVRIFCRDPLKSPILFRAFEDWCKTCNASMPVMTMSQF